MDLNYYIDADTFGSDLPVNYEDVIDEFNRIIDEHMENNPDETYEDFRDFREALWENAMRDMRVGDVEIIG